MDMLAEQGGIAEVLNAKVLGNGTKTLVLSHGFGADQNVWHFMIPILACYFKVVVFDMIFSPNVNPRFYDPKKYSTLDSYARDLLCLLDQLNIDKAIYLGHSMSAMIGCIAATERPQLFDHLILLSGSPRYLNAKKYKGGFQRSDIETFLKAMDEDFPVWVRNFAPKAIGLKNKTAIAEFENSLGRMDPKIALSVAKTVFLSDLRRLLPRVQVPCTIIQSRKDIIVPESVAVYMKRKVGDDHARVEILETEGHLPQLTAYPLLLDILKRVLHVGDGKF